jgi:hypothetical protein
MAADRLATALGTSSSEMFAKVERRPDMPEDE